MRFYEDFDPGETREVGRHVVTREEIVAFAKQWDPRPFHVDEEAAARSVFGGLTASSCHTYALTARITHAGGEDVAAAANLKTELAFPHPVRPGDCLTLRSECLQKRLSRSHPGLGVVSARSRLENQEGTVVLVMDTVSLIRRRETQGEYAGMDGGGD